MSTQDFANMSDEELSSKFIELWIEMGEAYGSSSRRYRRLFKEQHDLETEAIRRSPDAYRIFIPALRHENPWARYGAVHRCYDAMTEEALAVLKELATLKNSFLGPIASVALDVRIGALKKYSAPEWAKPVQKRE